MRARRRPNPGEILGDTKLALDRNACKDVHLLDLRAADEVVVVEQLWA